MQNGQPAKHADAPSAPTNLGYRNLAWDHTSIPLSLIYRILLLLQELLVVQTAPRINIVLTWILG